jgi:hypothetical protein
MSGVKIFDRKIKWKRQRLVEISIQTKSSASHQTSVPMPSLGEQLDPRQLPTGRHAPLVGVANPAFSIWRAAYWRDDPVRQLTVALVQLRGCFQLQRRHLWIYIVSQIALR